MWMGKFIQNDVTLKIRKIIVTFSIRIKNKSGVTSSFHFRNSFKKTHFHMLVSVSFLETSDKKRQQQLQKLNKNNQDGSLANVLSR